MFKIKELLFFYKKNLYDLFFFSRSMLIDIVNYVTEMNGVISLVFNCTEETKS